MKSLIILSALILWSTFSYSQGERRSFLAFKAGYGAPVGKFGKSENSKDAGYAKGGLASELSYSHLIKTSNTGYLISWRTNTFVFNAPKVAEDLTGNGAGWSGSSTSNYQLNAIYLGSFTEYKLGDGLFFSIKAMIGAAFTKFPTASFDGRTSNQTAHMHISGNTGASFSMVLGAGLRIPTKSGKYAFTFDADYMNADTKFKVTTETLISGQSFTDTSTTKQPINSINVMAGFAFMF
jgi:hypothetical protein